MKWGVHNMMLICLPDRDSYTDEAQLVGRPRGASRRALSLCDELGIAGRCRDSERSTERKVDIRSRENTVGTLHFLRPL